MSAISESRNIFLVGFMGAGKTTVGRELQRMTGFRLIDLDARIVGREGRTIPEIFAREGETVFRKMESEALRSLADVRKAIVATGGGVVGCAENWKIMRRLGTIVYLRSRWETLRARLVGTKDRPLAANGDWSRVKALLEQRLPLYEQADIVVETDGLDVSGVARIVIEKMEMAQDG